MKQSEALHLRKTIEKAAQSLLDNEALTVVTLHPHWELSEDYTVGYKV